MIDSDDPSWSTGGRVFEASVTREPVRAGHPLGLHIASTACSSDTTGPTTPAIVKVFRGNDQIDSVGGTIADSAVVLVRDVNGYAVPNITITWVASGTGYTSCDEPGQDGGGPMTRSRRTPARAR